uniref:Uncharacterized protein n=1 Tax=Rhizophora mucronata TaxID=61149 RepID=A0A2P2PC81_RHIMU
MVDSGTFLFMPFYRKRRRD